MKRANFLCGCMALCAAACWSPSTIVNRAVNQTVDATANRVGNEVGKAIAADILANNPHLIQAYAIGAFNAMFYQGGYYFQSGAYEPGEFTTYRASGYEEGDWMQKTLLREHSNGNQWWRVETRTKDGDGATATVVMEALFSEPLSTGSRRVLRMRAQLPGEEAPREIPITEQNANSWYMAEGTRLTEESKEGMLVGTESIETPAGTFQTQHLRTTHHDNSTMSWYLNPEVPGELVKFVRTRGDSDDVVYQVELLEHGSGATESKLGIDLAEASAPAESEGEVEGDGESDGAEPADTEAEEETGDDA